MLGTAFPAARLLLVEQPFPWGPEGLRTSRFDRRRPRWRSRPGPGRRACASRPSAARARRPHRAHRRWMLVDTRDEHAVPALGRVRRGRGAARAPARRLAGRARPGAALPRLHARPARPVLRAARPPARRGARGRPARTACGRPATWAAAGSRPRVLVLPLGLMYGRVPPSAAAELVAATDAGRGGRRRCCADGSACRRPRRPRSASPTSSWQLPRCAISPWCRRRRSTAATVARARSTARRGASTSPWHRHRVDAAGLTCAAPGPSWFVAHRPVGIEPVDDI